MAIQIGTSGYSYKDWIGSFYPEGLPEGEWLPFYAHEFGTTELNFTYYRLPAARTLQAIAAKVPETFRFSVKAFSGITHEGDLEQIAPFVAALRPLQERGQLAAVLAQFPYRFHNTPENRERLQRLREGFGELPVAVEFRTADWFREEIFALLGSLELAYVSVDMPALRGLLPPEARATTSLGYVRFHGRNAANWWQSEESWQRYNYNYSEAELRPWIPRLRTLEAATETTLVYTNNHWRGQATRTARLLRQLLETME